MIGNDMGSPTYWLDINQEAVREDNKQSLRETISTCSYSKHNTTNKTWYCELNIDLWLKFHEYRIQKEPKCTSE